MFFSISPLVPLMAGACGLLCGSILWWFGSRGAAPVMFILGVILVAEGLLL